MTSVTSNDKVGGVIDKCEKEALSLQSKPELKADKHPYLQGAETQFLRLQY